MTALALATAVQALRDVPRGLYAVAADRELVELTRLLGEARSIADQHLALAAAESDRRSPASRSGARTTEEFLKKTAGLTGREAALTTRVGRLTREDAPVPAVGAGVADGTVSIAAADAIRAGLEGVADVAPDLLAQAAELLVGEAQKIDADQLFKRAREVRDELDEAGISSREELLRSRRSLRRLDLRDGMKRIIWDYDPLSGGVIDEVYDRLTSPRRGGPRFVDDESRARASALSEDPRTLEQIASDGFAELLGQAAAVDETLLVGRGAPGVRVLVPVDDLATGAGHGTIEGSNEVVSLATVRHLICANGSRTALIDSVGNVLDLGRTQRLFSAAQRVALAIRDGGCMWVGCERPPSWTEAHHIDHWEHGGRTDLDRGILLCRHHHLRLHNEGWSIARRAARFWLEPPPGSASPGALLETKSRAMRSHVRPHLQPAAG